MAWEPGPDDEIEFKQKGYGPARIEKIISGLNCAQIRLLSGTLQNKMITCKINDLKSESEKGDIILIKVGRKFDEKKEFHSDISSNQKGTRTDSAIHHKKCIDALRFGLVPGNYLKDLTLNYEELVRWIYSSFPESNDNKPIVHQISGPFGEGKSHTISLIREIALNEGYIVGNVEVDGKKITLADPKSFLYSLFTSVKGRDLKSPMPLLELYLKAIHKRKGIPDIAPRNKIDRVKANAETIDILDRRRYLGELGYLVNDVLLCSEEITATEAREKICAELSDVSTKERKIIKLYPMIGQKLIDHPNDFIEAIIGVAAIATFAGYKGFIITVDEFEVESYFVGRKLDRSIKILDILYNYFSSDSDHPAFPLAIYFASVPECKSEESVSESKSEKPEQQFIDDIVTISGGESIYTPIFTGWNPNDEDQRKLVESIHTIYLQAYSCPAKPFNTIIEHLNKKWEGKKTSESGEIRRFIKYYLFYLDTLYGPPPKSNKNHIKG